MTGTSAGRWGAPAIGGAFVLLVLADGGTAAAATYDSANRLRTYQGVELRYDALGNVVQRCHGGVCTHVVVDDRAGMFARVVAEVKGTATVSVAYGPLGLALERTSTTRFALVDHLGSVRGFADAAGAIPETRAYTAFGSPRHAPQVASTSVGYTGELTDSLTGAVWLRSRSFHPSIGRFAQRDTFAGFLANPQSLNRYAYVQNDPLAAVDPSGQCRCRPAPICTFSCELTCEVPAANAVDQVLVAFEPASTTLDEGWLALDARPPEYVPPRRGTPGGRSRGPGGYGEWPAGGGRAPRWGPTRLPTDIRPAPKPKVRWPKVGAPGNREGTGSWPVDLIRPRPTPSR